MSTSLTTTAFTLHTRGYRLDHVLSERNNKDGIRVDLQHAACRDMHIDACYLSSNNWGMQVLDSGGTTNRCEQHNWVIHAKENDSGGVRIKDIERFEESFVRIIGGPGVELGTGSGGSIEKDTFIINSRLNTGDDLIIGANCSESIFIGKWDTLTWSNSATQNVVNGVAKNSDDPRVSGVWNGNAAKAYRTGARVYGISTTPTWTPYRADGNGEWHKVSTETIATGTVTHTSGGSTTFEEDLGLRYRNRPLQARAYDDPNGTQPSASYQYDVEPVIREWDESGNTQRVDGTLVWDNDAGSDVDVKYEIVEPA